MQRVANCILTKDQEVLLLRKPRRGWWVAPGGKMESGESIKESVMREFNEETGVTLKNPQLRGIFTFVIEEKNKVLNEWMMFTFFANEFNGTPLKESPEGIITWHHTDQIFDLPMAPGDYHIFRQVLNTNKVIIGTFTYTKDFELLSYRLDVDGERLQNINTHNV